MSNAFQGNAFQGDAFQAGQNSSKIGAYLRGKDILRGDLSVYLVGEVNTSENQSAFLKGKSSGQSSKGVYLTGHSQTLSSIGCYLSGISNAVDSCHAYISVAALYTSSVNVFICGSDDALSSSSAYLSGKSDSSSSQSVNTTGKNTFSGSLTCYLYGEANTSSSVSAYTLGQITSYINSYVSGSVNNLDTCSAYLSGNLGADDSVSAYLLGAIADNQPAYLRGYIKGTLLGFDFSYLGQPLANLTSKTGIDTNTLDWFIWGEPFWSPGTFSTKSSKSAYLYGAGGASVRAYLRGSDPFGRVNVYLRGGLIKTGFVRAYTNATHINTLDETTCFCSGNVLSLSSIYAFALGRSTHYIKQSAYLSGISRSFVPVYLNSEIVYVDHIWLKADDGSLSRKFLVLQQDYEDGTKEGVQEIHKTISGGLDHSIGELSTTWRMIIRVKQEEIRSNYGDQDDLEYFFSLSNPNGTPSNTLIFIDHRGYEYRVRMLGSMTKNLVSTIVEGQDALYLYRLELIDRV